MIAVGRPGRLLADATAEYEKRAARYWPVEFIDVKEERAPGADDERIRRAETERLLQRVPPGLQIVALTRDGDEFSSRELATFLNDLAVQSHPGAAFLIGGALGLHETALEKSHRQLSISRMTLPHEMARLLLAEQLYRAGTILRGEPYHKGRA